MPTTAIRGPAERKDSEEPGQRLRKTRERLLLRYRDVEEASQVIARRRGNKEFVIGLSRLADIENRGTVPSLYRLYSLCAIYRLEFSLAMRWYGADLGFLHSDGAMIRLEHTHLTAFEGTNESEIDYPLAVDASFDPRQTDHLNRHLKRWGKLPLSLLRNFNIRHQRFGFIGTDDWSMYPILSPGSFVQIDEGKRKIINYGWSNEFDRPIYFLEHRTGFRCCWCADVNGSIVAYAHPSSPTLPEVFKAKEIDVIGQVVGVARRLDLGKRRHTRSLVGPE